MALLTIVTDDSGNQRTIRDSRLPERHANAYARESADASVLVMHGWAMKLAVSDGQLVLTDGSSRNPRIRKIAPGNRTVSRIWITGGTGMITLAGINWCADRDIAVGMISSAGDVIMSHVPPPEQKPRELDILRAQFCASESLALEIAREIEGRKLAGQERNIIEFTGDKTTALRIADYRRRIESAEDIHMIGSWEGVAAKEYFAEWKGTVSAQFDDRSAERIPADWMQFSGRRSQLTGNSQGRNASDPVNALLNFAYALGANECRLAAIVAGLDPRYGYVHGQKHGRDNLAYDMLETIRPEIDRYIVGLVRNRIFSRRDFSALPTRLTPAGTVRVMTPLANEIAEYSYSWHKPASEIARMLVKLLTGGHIGGRGYSHVTTERDAFMATVATADDILPEKLWPEIEPLLPPRKPLGQNKKTFISDRTVLAAMIYLTRNGRPWRQVPPSFGVTHWTLNGRRREWIASGYWPAIEARIKELAHELS